MNYVWCMIEGTNVLGIYDNEAACKEDVRRYGGRVSAQRFHVDSEPQVEK